MSLPIIDPNKIVSHLKYFMSPLCINVFSVIHHLMNTYNLNCHVSKQCEFLEIGENLLLFILMKIHLYGYVLYNPTSNNILTCIVNVMD
jgi:hypothetical protein